MISERLAQRIRASLGEHNDPDKPVQWLVEQLVERHAHTARINRDFRQAVFHFNRTGGDMNPLLQTLADSEQDT